MFLLLLATLAHAEDVQVTSNVKGARILLDGVDTGRTTPATLTGVTVGTHTIVIEQGCMTGEATVNVLKGTGAKAALLAETGTGSVIIKPEPANAKVYLDDVALNLKPGTSLDVECGSHTVRGELPGFTAKSVSFDVGLGDTQTIPLVLGSQGLAKLELSVRPRTAKLYLDDKEVGSDAVVLPSVSAGSHVIKADDIGYDEAVAKITVVAGQSQAWHFELEHSGGKKESTATQIGGAAPPAEAAGSSSSSSSSAASGGSDYFSRLRAEGGDTEELDEPASTGGSKSSSSSSSSSKSSTASTSSSSSKSSTSKTTSPDLDEDEDLGPSGDPDDLDLDEPSSRSSSAKSSSSGSSRSTTTTTKEKSGGGGGKLAAGVTTMVLGAGGLGAGGYFYTESAGAYKAYTAKRNAAEEAGDQDLLDQANDLYDNEVVPNRNLMFASAGGGVVLLTTGIVIVAIDADHPWVAPVKGGAVVGWRVGF